MRKQATSRSTRARRARSLRPVVATAVLSLGLVCAAAFTGITVQANALERAKGVLSDEITAEQARTLRVWANYELAHGDRGRGDAMRQAAREIFGRLEMELEVERMNLEEPNWVCG